MDSKGLHHSSKSLSLDEGSKSNRSRALSIKDRKDSGYISPITPASAATSTEGSVIRRSLSGAQTQALASSSGETSPEFLQSPIQEGQPLSLAASTMQRTVHNSPQGTYQEEPISPEALSAQFSHLKQQRLPPSNLNTNDIILLAFQCQTVHNDWSRCSHPYCYKIRRHWELFRRCCANIQSCCSDCSNFKKMIVDHSMTCTNLECPVVMCNEAKNLFQAQKEEEVGENSLRRSLQRSQSFTQRTPVTEYAGLEFLLSNYSQYGDDMGSYSSLGATREMIHAKAQEIVDRLDQEEPLLANDRPRSLPHDDIHDRGTVGNALSPIVEAREDLSMNSDNYSYDHPVSLILRNGSYAYSSLGDGTGLSGSMPSLGGISQPPSGLIIEQPVVQPVKQVVYPNQRLIQKLDNLYLMPGQDGYYYQDRDYYINDVESLGSGGFGTCMQGMDNTTEQLFAMKRNKEHSEKIIDSMTAECFVLSRLKPHDNVIRFLGAVIDEEDNNVILPKVCKLFMELADCGNLSEMLVVDQTPEGVKILEPLHLDQALYYIEQVLQGVNYLHQNNVLHLDIKALNVLVFDGGRTVKLADFGTAVQLSEISAVGGKIVGCTPYFAAPEVVRQEQPHFSSDIWSVMCVLVELLTTKWPGCHIQSNTHQQMIYLVGCYKDTNIEQLVPLSQMNLDPAVETLFRRVFVADSKQRLSALTLLKHPSFREAREYAREFEECYVEEEMSHDPIQEAMPICEVAAAQLAQYSHIPYTPPQATAVVGTSTPFTPQQASEHHSYAHAQQGYPSLDCECDHPAVYKRESHDSGRGGDSVESSLISRDCPLRASTSSSGPDHRNSDSGIDTPYDVSLRKKFNKWSDDSFQEAENYEDYHSFPFIDHTRDPADFKRSSSMTGGTLNLNQSDSKNSTMFNPPQLVPSNHRLYHSFSAPIVGDQFTRRRASLQMNLGDKGEGADRPRLRRTSSMVYVDKGPDIDSPDREKRASIEELISDVSGLNLDHAHSPSHSRRTKNVQQESSTEQESSTVTRHVTEPLPRGRSKTMTVYETIC